MKKIAFYISDLEKGGAQRVISNLANYLIQNYEVTIITTVEGETSYTLNKGIRIISLDDREFKQSNYKNNRVVVALKRYKKLVRVINSLKPDVTITFLTREIYRILLIKPFIRTKTIISFRNDPNTVYNNKYKKGIISAVIRLANGIVFQTADAKSFFKDKVYKKSTIINNPINNDFIVKPYRGERKKEIVTVGKLYPQKNHKLLIDAFSRISSDFPEYKLVIYGEGALRGELEEQIRKLSLEGKVYLPGTRDDIQNYIYNASLFVLSSDFEGVSNAMLEALSLGLPVISTDSSGGGSKEVINHGVNGLLVPVNNVNELSESMERVLKDKDLSIHLSENASLIQEMLNPNQINKQWESFILKIIGG